MSSLNISRWSGQAAMLGGVLWVVQNVLVLTVEQIRWTEAVFILALILVLAGVAGFHTLQKDHYGTIGRSGFWIIVAASLVQVLGLLIFILGDATFFWLVFPVGYVAMIVGYTLFGAATLQAKVLPLWCGIAFIVGEPVTSKYVLGDYGGIVFGLLWVVLGYVLWSRRDAANERYSRVR